VRSFADLTPDDFAATRTADGRPRRGIVAALVPALAAAD